MVERGDEMPTIRRFQYLLNGRRVAVKDLIDAGLLEPGAALRYDRLGQSHSAIVTGKGELGFDDGRHFKTPSAAGDAISGTATPGWTVWIVAASGRSLDSLRQELLAQAAEQNVRVDDAAQDDTLDTSADQVGVPRRSSAQGRYEFLKEAREKANKGEPTEITVRALLAYWGASRRGAVICQAIDADLANHGLTTVPNYRKISLDGYLSLQALPDEEPAPSMQDDDEEVVLELRRTVGTLPSASAGVIWVTREATLDEALTKMLLEDYSQLAVLSGRNLVGAVTWKSIADARNANPRATLRDALVVTEAVSYDKDLRDILPGLQDTEFAFVKGATGTIDGIVTNADVVGLYGEVEEPFLLLGELDLALRAVVTSTFRPEEINALCNPDQDGFLGPDRMSFGDYQRVLENPSSWDKLGWALDRATFMKRLDEIRDFRNDFMHYNPDPDRSAIRKLREMIKVVRRYSGT